MNKQDQLRAILSDIKLTKGLSWYEAKQHVCGLLTKSPFTIDKWLSSGKYAQDIPDNELERLHLKWYKSQAEF